MSCQRLNIGFSPCLPDNNCKTDNYNEQFKRYIPNGKRDEYYTIQQDKQFISNDDNNNLLTQENYDLVNDLLGHKNVEEFSLRQNITRNIESIKSEIATLIGYNKMDNKNKKNKDYLQLIVFIFTIILIIIIFNYFKK